MWVFMVITTIMDTCWRKKFRPLASRAGLSSISDERLTDLVDAPYNIPINIDGFYFYHPDVLRRDGVSTFMCQGTELMARSVLGCEPIAKVLSTSAS